MRVVPMFDQNGTVYYFASVTPGFQVAVAVPHASFMRNAFTTAVSLADAGLRVQRPERVQRIKSPVIARNGGK